MKNNLSSKTMFEYGEVYKILSEFLGNAEVFSLDKFSDRVLENIGDDLVGSKNFWFECAEVQKIKERCLKQIEEISRQKDPEMVPSKTAKALAYRIIRGIYCFKNASGYSGLFDEEYRNHEPDIMPDGSNGIIIEFTNGNKSIVSINIDKTSIKSYIYRRQNLLSDVEMDVSITNIVKHLVWLYESEIDSSRIFKDTN